MESQAVGTDGKSFRWGLLPEGVDLLELSIGVERLAARITQRVELLRNSDL